MPDKPDVYSKPANGETAGSYLIDGTWNIGGWATYPSADELALNAAAQSATTSGVDTPQVAPREAEAPLV